MKNLTEKEKEYILKNLNYDLRMATEALEESLYCSTDVNNSARNGHKLALPKHKLRIEFLIDLKQKLTFK